MKRVTIYDISTGSIKSLMECPEEEVTLNIPEGCDWVEGYFMPDSYTIQNGNPVENSLPSKEDVEAKELEIAWQELRFNRNTVLSACDWTQVADAPVDQVAWQVYRQALRDLPANTADPKNPTWPTKP